MPLLMQLQGPSLGAMRLRKPQRYTLLGVGDTIATYPLVMIGGLVLGGYLAHKHIRPFKALKAKLGLGGHRRRRRR